MAYKLSFVGGGRTLKDKSGKKFTFIESLAIFWIKPISLPANSAFSIAEAMITLLLVSITLAAMAPIISKQQKANIMAGKKSEMPPGAVVYFDLKVCPDGWAPVSAKYPQSENAFIRNLSGTLRKAGSFEEDAAPNITGKFAINHEMIDGSKTAGAFRIGSAEGGSWDGQDWSYTLPIFFDASRSSSVYGRDSSNEIRPKNIAFLACRKS